MPDYRLVDQWGLSKNNTYLVIDLPAYDSALVFRVRQRVNTGYEKFIYGQLPITSGETFSSYTSGTTSAPGTGIFPSLSYTALNQAMQFPAPTVNGAQLNTFDTTDIWYQQYDTSETLFEVKQYLTPSWLRVAVSIPSGTGQSGFQQNKVQGGVNTYNSAFGFARGSLDIFHIPTVHYGYLYGNDTNLVVDTKVTFVYGEYTVQIPSDPNVIFDAIQGNIPARHTTLPMQTPNQQFANALGQDYGSGFQGFPIFPNNQAGRKQAIQAYMPFLRNIPVGLQ